MVVSIFGKSLLNASASRLHLQSQRGKVVDKWSRPFGRGSGRDSLRSSVRRAHPQGPDGSRPWTAEEGQEALNVPAHTEVPGIYGTRPRGCAHHRQPPRAGLVTAL